MNVLIPLGKATTKIKSSPHQSLVKITKQLNLLEFQISVLENVYDNLKIYLFVDEYKDEIIDVIKGHRENGNLNNSIDIVDEKYQTLSSCLKSGFNLIGQEECIVLMGNVIFNKAAVRCLFNRKVSSFLVDNKGFFPRGEVGLWHNHGKIKNFSYSLPLKWSHICYLTPQFVEKYLEIYEPHFLPHEIFNKIIEQEEIHIIQSKHAKAIEIDKPKDARLARQIFG